MIPVENAAGRAAFILHDQPEGAPDQNTDQITYIEAYGNHEQPALVDNPGVIQHPNCRDQGDPDQHNLVRSFCGSDYVFFQCLIVDFFPQGTEPVGKELLRPKGHFIFYRNDLQDHIRNPDKPQKVQRGKSCEKVPAFQNRKHLRSSKAHQQTQYKNRRPANKAHKISLSGF